MKQKYSEKRTAVLAVAVILILIVADFSSRTAIKDAMAARTHVPITCVESEKCDVALTYTLSLNSDVDAITDSLGETKATFFIEPDVLEKKPEDVKKIAENGHEIGIARNDLKKNTQQEIYDKLAGMTEQTAHITGVNTNLVRFGLNLYDSNAVKAVFSVDLYPIQWSTDGTVGNYSAGDIILVTDDTDVKALIEKLKADGFNTVTVGELLVKGSYKIDIGGRMIPD